MPDLSYVPYKATCRAETVDGQIHLTTTIRGTLGERTLRIPITRENAAQLAEELVRLINEQAWERLNGLAREVGWRGVGVGMADPDDKEMTDP